MNEVYKDHWEKEYRFGEPVEITCCFEKETIGRLVQVRKNKGQFGSDIYFVRLLSGKLVTFENVGLQPYHGAIHEIDEFEDSIEVEYTIQHEYPETGFIIENPAQPASPSPALAITVTYHK